MKGKVLDYNLQESCGIISGEDGNRYEFASSEWKSTQVHPSQGIEVDFDIQEGKAVGVYTEVASTASPTSNANMAKYIYIGYIVGLFVPFVSLIGVIVAYVNKGNNGNVVDEHYRYQIRTFWIGFLYFFISFLLTMILIGWLMVLATYAWYIVRCVKGLKALDQNKAPDNVDGWGF